MHEFYLKAEEQNKIIIIIIETIVPLLSASAARFDCLFCAALSSLLR